MADKDDPLLAALLNGLCMDIIWKNKTVDKETIVSQDNSLNGGIFILKVTKNRNLD